MTLRLIVFDIDEDTGAKSVREFKEQDVYMGDMPLMTANGTFIVNGTERVIVSQMHRSPGVFFDHDKGKTHSSGKLLFAARIIPYRGSWLDIEFDAKDVIHARIDRKRKIPVSSLLMALGMDAEEILSTFYDKIDYQRDGEGWRLPYDPDQWTGVKVVTDLVNAETGEVAVEAGKKITPRQAKKLADGGLKYLRAETDDLDGRYLAEDVVDMQTGEVWAEAGDELSVEVDAKSGERKGSLIELLDRGVQDLPILGIDTSTWAAISARRWRSTRTSRAATRCSTSTASSAPASPPPSTPPRRCSSRSSSTPSATTCRPSAG